MVRNIFSVRSFSLVLCCVAFLGIILAGNPLLAEEDTLKSCRVCHGDTNDWIKGQAGILKTWTGSNDVGIPSSHMWLSPELVKKVAGHKLALSGNQVKVEDSFFHKLTVLKDKAKATEPDKAAKDEWVKLLKIGQKQIPGFDALFWEPGLAVLATEGSIRGHLLNLGKAILTPYRKVLLFPGQKAVYEQILETGVKGVAFMKGSSSRFDNELIYEIVGTKDGKNKIKLTLKDTKTDYTIKADFLLDRLGAMSEFKSDPPEHKRAQQFAKRWAKAKRDRLDSFTTEHVLDIPDMAGRSVEPVTLVIEVKTEGIVDSAVIEGETIALKTPCLHAKGTFKQKEGEHMGIRGNISLYMMANGLTAYSDNRMSFKKRASGIMINANSRDRMTIDPKKSVVHPSFGPDK